jgi:hypothetical protein
MCQNSAWALRFEEWYQDEFQPEFPPQKRRKEEGRKVEREGRKERFLWTQN